MHYPVLEVLDLRCVLKLRRGADDADRFLERKARLFAIGGGADDLAGRNALGPERVQKRQRAAERGLTVPPPDLQIYDPGEPPAVVMSRPINAPDDPELPRVPRHGAVRQARFRVAHEPQEIDRALAMAERIGDRGIVE